MSGDVTRLLNAMRQGEAAAPDELIRAVYDELRQLASRKLAHERPGNTLETTALVHEVYLRLGESGQVWENRRHFFAAAAEAMRRILVESARRKGLTSEAASWAATTWMTALSQRLRSRVIFSPSMRHWRSLRRSTIKRPN